MDAKYIQIEITFPTETEAKTLALMLIEKRLAACCQTSGPILSHYTWEGKTEIDEEYLVVIKTKAELFERIEAEVKASHPYSCPQILALPIVGGSADYLAWIEEAISEKSAK